MHPAYQNFLSQLKTERYSECSTTFSVLSRFANAIAEVGGETLLVGGTVRDIVLWIIPKDFDVEVRILDTETVEKVASEFWNVLSVGKSFGILKLQVKDGLEIDISSPRRDSKTGKGHRGFEISVDPHMSIEDASRRRDFTFNTMCIDILSGELYDYHGGMGDIENRILRVTDEATFWDDPLRVLRGIQFVGRFGLQVDPKSFEIMRDMVPQLNELPKERLSEEWKKLLLKSPQPSLGLQVAMDLGLIHAMHSELAALPLTPQDPTWHPEWDVWIHTLMVVDQAARLVRRQELSEVESLIIMFAALCHDLGKPVTTKEIDGRITSRNHEEEGEAPTRSFLDSIGVPEYLVSKIVPLVCSHLSPSLLYKSEIDGSYVKDGALRRLANKLHPATFRELVILAEADYYGRTSPREPEYFAGKWLLERTTAIAIESQKPEDAVSGKDLVALGFQPGAKFRELIAVANAFRDDDGLEREEIMQKLKSIEIK